MNERATFFGPDYSHDIVSLSNIHELTLKGDMEAYTIWAKD
jgi:hypothetical protein